jgi:hypothetical protein
MKSCGSGRSLLVTLLSDLRFDTDASRPDAPGAAVRAALARRPATRRERFLTLLDLYELALGPITRTRDAASLLMSPEVTALKADLERDWLLELDSGLPPIDLSADAADAIRALAVRERLPEIYRWLSRRAGSEEVRHFLALEGGPDAGFDDLVAICQVGITGRPKQEMARNYWDEMGDGEPDDVHTTLHEVMAAAMDLPEVPIDERPTAALERSALGGLLATNRWLQPEMIGALGLIELQAGPRCRTVLQAMERIGAPEHAQRFYAVHADVDPRHGNDWMNEVIEPFCTGAPEMSHRVVRGAWWRWRTNAAFFSEVAAEFLPDSERLISSQQSAEPAA